MRARSASVSGVWKPVLVCAVCGLYALYCLLSRPLGPITAPDSAGYLAFAPVHLLGYVSFLKLVGAQGAMIAQPMIFAIALARLGIVTLRLTSSVALSTAMVTAPTLIPGLRTYHYSVLTESLFMSCLLAFLACVIGFVRAPSARRVASASAMASLAAIVRSPGLALLVVVPTMILIAWRRPGAGRAAFFVAAAAPAVMIEFQASGPMRLLQTAVRAIGWVTGCLALFGVAAAVARRELPPSLMLACLGSLAAHASLLFYALFAAGIGRYTLGVWPAVTTAAFFGAWWAATSVRDMGQTRRLRHQDLHLE